jgi:lipid A 3-O-deacylase
VRVKTVSRMVLLSLSLATVTAHAADSASLEYATGNKSQFVRVGVQWNWEQQWFKSNGTHVSGYWDATLSEFRENRYQGTDATKSLTDIGITPVFRFETDDKKGLYAEAGIGAHYMSSIYDNNNRAFSTNFQFGDHIGVGYVMNSGWDVGMKIQHFSNGGIKHPNPGANFVVLKTAHTF